MVSYYPVLAFSNPVDSFLAFTTITSTAVLFAKTSLELPPSSLIVVGLLTPTAGILGSLIWPKVQQAYKLSNKTVLMVLVLLASLVPLYGCLGFLPGLKGRVGGLVTAGEMYALAVYFGEPKCTSAIIMLIFRLRFNLRCFPGFLSCCIFRTDPTWRGSTMVWVVLDHGQVE